MRGRMYLVVLAAATLSAVMATVAYAQHALTGATPVVTRKGWQYLPSATQGATYVAYSETAGRRIFLFVKPHGRRVQVTRRGQTYDGGFDGTTLIYQQAFRRRGVSDIHLYDAVSRARSEPDGVNTRAWEYEPTMSNDVILFGRDTRRREKVLLRDEDTQTTTVLVNRRLTRRSVTDPGQINGDWVTWSHFSFRSRVGNVFRYQISAHQGSTIPRPAGFAQYAPSMAPNGTMFYVRARTGCGHHVIIRENVPGEADMAIHRVPAGFDVFKTFVVDEGGGEFSVYFDQASCSGHGSNIYKLTV
jgi:hypothetical protein